MNQAEAEAVARVAEFIRQWPMGSHKGDLIQGVYFDPNADEVDLLASDLATLVAAVKTAREWHEHDCGALYGDKPHWHPKDSA